MLPAAKRIVLRIDSGLGMIIIVARLGVLRESNVVASTC